MSLEPPVSATDLCAMIYKLTSLIKPLLCPILHMITIFNDWTLLNCRLLDWPSTDVFYIDRNIHQKKIVMVIKVKTPTRLPHDSYKTPKSVFYRRNLVKKTISDIRKLKTLLSANYLLLPQDSHEEKFLSFFLMNFSVWELTFISIALNITKSLICGIIRVMALA